MAPGVSKPFVFRTDTSDTSLGAVLLQEDGGVLHAVAYARRKLSESEKRYSLTERECLALVWDISKFYLYRCGNLFVVQTDHQPREFVHPVKYTNSRLMRWSLALQEYRFHVQFIRSIEHLGADFLGRLLDNATEGWF